MIDLDTIGEDLFSKIRGRFPNVTIGDSEGTITNEPKSARFFDFDYKDLGKVSVSISEDDGLSVIYSKDFISNEDQLTQKEWYNFLKELRQFARKRLLNFDVRDVNKSNLNKRDYKFLATNRSGDDTMTESKLYGTSRVSYQKVGEARIVIKHTESINQESATGRTQKIGKIYIESAEGERFKYPYKHLSGARAMARHVAEGGNAYDDFGKHIVGLSEEMSKLRKFKNYMGRSAVMAESLAGYMDIVKERITTVKKTIEGLQKPAYYKETFEAFNPPVLEDVPSDVAENWIDELTIKQFNEELQDIFPYIYNLVKEGTKAVELGPEDLVDESALMAYAGKKKHGAEYMKKAAEAGRKGASQEELGRLKDKYSKAEKNKKTKEEFELEQAFEDTMGQFADAVCEECGNPSWRTLDEEKQKGVDGKVCWKGYRRMGTKMKGGKRVDNCVKIKEDESGAEIFHDGTTIYPKVGDKVEVFYTSTDENPDNAVGVIVGQGEGKQQWKVKFKDNETGEVMTNTYSSHDEFMILDKDRDNPDRIKDREQGELPMPGGKTNRRNVKDPAGQDEGNAYSGAVAQAKKDGKKPGDKIKGPDGDEITLEKDDKTPLGEFILSYYDRETGKFPKGETAVLTMVEKDYGEQFIEPAKAFIESVHQTFEAFQMAKPSIEDSDEYNRMRELAGLR